MLPVDTTQVSARAIETNVTVAIRRAKREGTVGMSIDNLRQITPTTGVMCPVPQYRGLFAEVAAMVAKKLRFDLI